MIIPPAESDVWNMNMTLNMILMTAGVNFMSRLSFSFSILYCSPDFFSLVHVSRLKPTYSVDIFSYLFHFSSSRPVFDYGYLFLFCNSLADTANKSIIRRNSLGAIYSLDMIYYSTVTCQLLAHGNELCIAFSVIV